MFATWPTHLKSDVRYELPTQGISLLGYVVRRMHKTTLLAAVPDLLATGQTAAALAQVALYAVGASVSFGPAYYQPQFNRAGASLTEADPATGAVVTAKLESTDPHYRIAYSAHMPDGALFSGGEVITGTTVGFSGLGMPAPSHFHFATAAGAYNAELAGLLTSELAPGLLRWRIRAHGNLRLSDNQGHTGQLTLRRDGEVRLVIQSPTGPTFKHHAHIGAP